MGYSLYACDYDSIRRLFYGYFALSTRCYCRARRTSGAAKRPRISPFGSPTEQDAELALNQRRPIPAIAIYSKLIAATPKKFKLYLGRGIAYYNAGQYEKAALDFTSFSKLRPALVEGYMNRAYAYERLGRYKLALADLETVEAIDPYRVDRKLRGRLLAATP